MNKISLNASQLKIIAIIGMTFDHIAIVFSAYLPFWAKLPMYLVGGLTFPIMGYLLVEGYRKTSNVKRYMLRLLVWGIIAQIPYIWALYPMANVIITLFLALVMLYADEHIKKRAIFYVVLILMAVVTLFTCDWGGFGILLVFFYAKIKDEKKRIAIPVAFMSGVMILSSLLQFIFLDMLSAWLNIAFFAGSLIVIPLLIHYNGERGRPMKYFFYAYYPAHLLILAALRWLLQAG